MTLHACTNQGSAGPALHIADEVDALLDVIEQLTAYLRAENDLLDLGLPPYAAGLTEKKEELGERFNEMWRDVLGRGVLHLVDEARQNQLIRSGQTLSRVGHANLARLEAQLDRSRRRVESVLSRAGCTAGKMPPLSSFVPGSEWHN